MGVKRGKTGEDRDRRFRKLASDEKGPEAVERLLRI